MVVQQTGVRKRLGVSAELETAGLGLSLGLKH